MVWDNTLLELFDKGGVCMWPLLGCSILGLAIILERTVLAIWLHTSYRSLVWQFERLLRAGRIEEARNQARACRGPIAHIIGVYLNHLETPKAIRDEVLGREGSEQVARRERRLNWLGTIASISTLLGLLGTVTGLVRAFHQIELDGGQVQPGDLAAGIWEALVTTVFGLSIAIPCMATYQLLDHWAGAVAVQLQWIVAHLDEWLYSQPHSAKRSDDHSADKLGAEGARLGTRN